MVLFGRYDILSGGKKLKFCGIFLVGILSVLTHAVADDAMPIPENTPQVQENKEYPFGEYLAGRFARANKDIHTAADYYQKALVKDPDNITLLKRSFSLFIGDGRYDAALDVAKKLRDQEKSDNLLHLLLFLENIKTKDYPAGKKRLETLGDVGVYGLFRPLFRAWTLLAQGRMTEAEEVMTILLASEGFESYKKYHAALFYQYAGNDERAEKLFAQSLIKDGMISLRSAQAYGRLLNRIGRTEDARQLYENYLEKASMNDSLKQALDDLDQENTRSALITSERDGIAEIFYTAAIFLMQDDIRSPAIIYLRYAKYLKTDFPLADYLLGQIFERNEYYGGALEILQQIPQDNVLHFSAQMQMAWVLEKMGKLEEAIGVLRDLYELYPQKQDVLATLGDLYRMNSRFVEAIEAYSQMIGALDAPQENHWGIFYTRGIVLEREGRWAEAEKDLLKALELRPNQPQVMNYLGYSWVDKGMHIERATKMLARAVELRPNDGYIVDSMGWALYRTGDHPAAVEYLEKAVLLQADDWAINDHLGDAYWAVGRKTEARFQWRHALSLKPDEEKISLIKTKIKNGI